MKQIVEVSEQTSFLERFYGFSDAVIRSITLRFADDGSKELDASLLTRDAMTQENEGWVCTVISVGRVSEMAIHERAKTTIQVISQGIHVAILDETIGLEFGGAVDPPRSLTELRNSDAFVVGESLSFQVLPYETQP